MTMHDHCQGICRTLPVLKAGDRQVQSPDNLVSNMRERADGIL